MSDTYVTCSVSPCTIIYQVDLPPFQLDVAGGALIASAILVIWAIGWAFRVIIHALNIDGVKPFESDL